MDEMELCATQAREALQCVLHTVLFCRAPGPFRPQTVHLEVGQPARTEIRGRRNHWGPFASVALRYAPGRQRPPLSRGRVDPPSVKKCSAVVAASWRTVPGVRGIACPARQPHARAPCTPRSGRASAGRTKWTNVNLSK